MLLYARMNEAIQPNQSYLMSGNRIEVRTLDLSKEFPAIAVELDEIAERHFGEPPRARGEAWYQTGYSASLPTR